MPQDPVPQKKSKYPSDVWVLYYRYGTIPCLQKFFRFGGDMVGAINRAREHCIKMNYQFICIRPFLVDLDEQEIRREERKNGED